MLPSPASFSQARARRRKTSVGGLAPDLWRRRLTLLLSRSRATNLGVLLLALALSLSILLNFRYWIWLEGKSRDGYRAEQVLRDYGDGAREAWHVDGRVGYADVPDAPPALQALDHLVVVPGHGVWLGNSGSDAANASMWALDAQLGIGAHDEKDVQRARMRVRAFVAHIRKGYIYRLFRMLR